MENIFETFDSFIGKKGRAARQEKKAVRKEAKQERKVARVNRRTDKKAAKVQAKTDRKLKRQANRLDRKDARQAQRQDRKAVRQDSRQAKRTLRTRTNQMKKFDKALEKQAAKAGVPKEELTSQILASESVQNKIRSYAGRAGGLAEDEGEIWTAPDVETQAAYALDVMGEDMGDIQEADEVWMEDGGYYDDEIDAEFEDPDYQDELLEYILEEEEEYFSFDGGADYLDPATAAVLANAGTKAAQKYREVRFAQGKKAFGKTKDQWEKEKEMKDSGNKQPGLIREVATEAKQAAIEEALRQQAQQRSLVIAAVLGLFLLLVMFKK